MGATEATETTYNVSPNLGGKIIKFKFAALENNDWVIFPDPIGAVEATRPTGATAATLYAKSDAASEVASATATSLTAATFTVNQRPASGYILVGTEIIKYSGATKSSATGNLTLDARGCFGTTAASHTGAIHTCRCRTRKRYSGHYRGMSDLSLIFYLKRYIKWIKYT
jgi:hypothetical protein